MDGRFYTMEPVADHQIAHTLVADLVALPQKRVRVVVHIPYEIHSCVHGRDAPVVLDIQLVFSLQFMLDELMYAMQNCLIARQEHHVIHVSVIIVHMKRFLDPVVEVGQHERGEYLAGVHSDGQTFAPGCAEDELVDDVQNIPVLYLALDQVEQFLTGDVVEILGNILFEIVFRPLWIGK